MHERAVQFVLDMNADDVRECLFRRVKSERNRPPCVKILRPVADDAGDRRVRLAFDARDHTAAGDRFQRCKPGVFVMHPGPMNRGIEISSDIADGDQSGILTQVTNGLSVRMAVLYLVTAAGVGSEVRSAS